DFEAELQAAGVETTTLSMAYGRPNPAGVWRLARLIHSWQPDLIHAHLFAATIVARTARLLAPAPVLLSTAHTPWEKRRGRYLLYRLTDPLAHLWTCVCAEGLENHVSARAVDAARARVVHNGIDPARFENVASRRDAVRAELGAGADFVWLTVGSFR